MKQRLIYLLVLILTLYICIGIPAYADTPDPDTTPTIERIQIFRNLLEPGDALMVWEANIPYATPPTTKIGDTFIWQLIDTDGTTVLGYITGYPYYKNGFGYNVYSMYYGEATDFVWGTAYTLRLSGNPSVFVTPPSYNFNINIDAYTSLTTQADNKQALADEVLNLADELNNHWGLTGDDILTFEMEAGTVLSVNGENFFRGAIFSIQGMAPAAFRFVITSVEAFNADREWDTQYTEDVADQYTGTWVEGAREAAGDLFGIDYDLLSIGILLALCVGLAFANIMLTADHWNGLIDIAFVLIIGARLGLYGLAYLGLILAVALVYLGTRLWKMIPQ